jgi:hypothetical protein
VIDYHLGYCDTAEVMAVYRISQSAVYYWASIAHWRRFRWDGRVYYYRGDVSDTLTARLTS